MPGSQGPKQSGSVIVPTEVPTHTSIISFDSHFIFLDGGEFISSPFDKIHIGFETIAVGGVSQCVWPDIKDKEDFGRVGELLFDEWIGCGILASFCRGPGAFDAFDDDVDPAFEFGLYAGLTVECDNESGAEFVFGVLQRSNK